MSLSFIQPRAKSVLAVELKWFLAVALTIIVILSLTAYLLAQAVDQERVELRLLEKKEQELHQNTIAMSKERQRLQELSKMHEKISINNRIKKENVKNFFDLVPDGVVLEFVELREKTLRLKGSTKSKKYFNQTFQRSLNSLFSRSTTHFKKMRNGHYHFNNISIVEAKGE